VFVKHYASVVVVPVCRDDGFIQITTAVGVAVARVGVRVGGVVDRGGVQGGAGGGVDAGVAAGGGDVDFVRLGLALAVSAAAHGAGHRLRKKNNKGRKKAVRNFIRHSIKHQLNASILKASPPSHPTIYNTTEGNTKQPSPTCTLAAQRSLALSVKVEPTAGRARFPSLACARASLFCGLCGEKR